jgi:hypothetical protein
VNQLDKAAGRHIDFVPTMTKPGKAITTRGVILAARKILGRDGEFDSALIAHPNHLPRGAMTMEEEDIKPIVPPMPEDPFLAVDLRAFAEKPEAPHHGQPHTEDYNKFMHREFIAIGLTAVGAI